MYRVQQKSKSQKSKLNCVRNQSRCQADCRPPNLEGVSDLTGIALCNIGRSLPALPGPEPKNTRSLASSSTLHVGFDTSQFMRTTENFFSYLSDLLVVHSSSGCCLYPRRSIFDTPMPEWRDLSDEIPA